MTDLQDVNAWREQGIKPIFPTVRGPSDRRVSVNGVEDCIMLASCDYLGFSNEAAMKQAAIDAITTYGTNICGSVAFSGMTALHKELQDNLAALFGFEDALVFTTSYLANLGTFSTLIGRDDLVLLDAMNHVSLFQAAQLTGAKIRTFPHLNYDVLERQLQRKNTAGRAFIATDGLFSADGDLADLKRLQALAAQYDAVLIVDSAHDFGVLGPTGRGLAEHDGVLDKIDLIIGTMSKAMGSTGGFVVGRREMIEKIRHFSGPYTSSRSFSPGVAGASLRALQLSAELGAQRREKLHENISMLWNGCRALDLIVPRTPSPVLSVFVNDAAKTLQAARYLMDHQICVCPMVSPSVQQGRERLRLNVTSLLEPDDCQHVLATLAQMAETGLLPKTYASADA